MDPIDKLLPLLILGVLGTILLVLLRRTAREKSAESVRQEAPKPVVVVATEVAPREDRTPPVIIVKEAVKPKRERMQPLPAPTAPPATIDTVLGMLRDQQTLAAAFLLREVFAPPVSRRARLPRDRQ
jgi:hypothetical protein